MRAKQRCRNELVFELVEERLVKAHSRQSEENIAQVLRQEKVWCGGDSELVRDV